MRRGSLYLTVISTIAVTTACASSTEASRDPRLIAGFDPPAPAAGEMRVVAPPVRAIPPGADVTYCTYIENPFTTPVDVVQSLGHQSSSGHHAVLMEVVGTNEPVGASHECTEKDMQTARFLAGGSDAAQDSSFRIPEGIGFRIAPSARLMVQTHWINATDAPIDGQAAFNLKVTKPRAEHQIAQLFTIGNTMFTLPMGLGSTSAECTIQQEMNVFTLGGHMHYYGAHAKVTHTPMGAADAAVLWEYDWSPEYESNPPRTNFTTANPMVYRAGDTLRVECDYDNTSGRPLPFPSEMCIAFSYAYPMTNQIDCMDGVWPTD